MTVTTTSEADDFPHLGLVRSAIVTDSARWLVLWDVDHTLVELPGVGKTWYAAALRELGCELHTHPEYSGRTELAITTEALAQHGLEPTRPNIHRIWDSLVRQSAAARDNFADLGRALPGAPQAVDTFADRGAVQTLVTGNLPQVARDKIAAFGLDRRLDLGIGGYGTLSVERSDLVVHAIARATSRYGSFPAARIVVIGDTPLDVEAALANDAVAVAVATGNFTTEQLTAAGAHVVLPDLEQLHAALQE